MAAPIEIAFDESVDGDAPANTVSHYNVAYKARAGTTRPPRVPLPVAGSPPPFTRRASRALPASSKRSPPMPALPPGATEALRGPASARRSNPLTPIDPAAPIAPTAAASHLPLPSFTPGSPIDVALASSVKVKSKLVRPRKPKILKILEHGEAGYEKKQREKQASKIIDQNHTQYHLSFGMMLGIFVSVRSGRGGLHDGEALSINCCWLAPCVNCVCVCVRDGCACACLCVHGMYVCAWCVCACSGRIGEPRAQDEEPHHRRLHAGACQDVCVCARWKCVC